MSVAAETTPSLKCPEHAEGVEDALLIVLMCLPNQRARDYASALLVGYEKATSRHFRWIIDQIDGATPEHVAFFAPHFELHRAKEVLEQHASSPGTGVEPPPEHDGAMVKRIRVQKAEKKLVIPKKPKIVIKGTTKVRIR